MIFIDSDGVETELECTTNYSHSKLVDMCSHDLDDVNVKTADFIEWVIKNGYYKIKNNNFL